MNPDQITYYTQYSPFHYCNYFRCRSKPESEALVNEWGVWKIEALYFHISTFSPISALQYPQLNSVKGTRKRASLLERLSVFKLNTLGRLILCKGKISYPKRHFQTSWLENLLRNSWLLMHKVFITPTDALATRPPASCLCKSQNGNAAAPLQSLVIRSQLFKQR